MSVELEEGDVLELETVDFGEHGVGIRNTIKATLKRIIIIKKPKSVVTHHWLHTDDGYVYATGKEPNCFDECYKITITDGIPSIERVER